jgi:hypothetical protein
MAEQILKVFSKDLQKNLFPANEFYKQSKLDSANGGTVEVPQSGSKPAVAMNASVPLTPSNRVDDVLTYSVNKFNTDPIYVEDANEAVINYSKRMDIMGDHIAALNTTIAENIATAWCPADGSTSAKTTGGTRPSSAGGAAVKAVTYEDILGLMTTLDAQDIPSDGRFLLASANMYADLLKLPEFISTDFQKGTPVVNGVVGEILGFKVYKRSKSVRYDNTFNKIASGTTGATTDRDAVIAWHKSFVRRSEGNAKTYGRFDDPEYLGSIVNAMVRAGGSKGRTNSEGVAVLIQDTFA